MSRPRKTPTVHEEATKAVMDECFEAHRALRNWRLNLAMPGIRRADAEAGVAQAERRVAVWEYVLGRMR